MVGRAARVFLEAGCRPLIAVFSDDRVRRALAGLPLLPVRNLEVERGVGRSIALGVTALPADARAAVIGVADQPLLTAAALSSLLQAFLPGSIVAPRYGRVLGNPRVFDRSYFRELAALEGERGGRSVSDRHRKSVIEVPLDVSMGLDVDRPEDWPGQRLI